MPPYRPALGVGAMTVVLALAAAPVTLAATKGDTAKRTDPTVSATPSDATDGPRVRSGVTVHGIDLSGMTRDEAIDAIRPKLSGHRPTNRAVSVSIAGRPHRLAMSSIDYGTDVGSTASRAIHAKAGTAIEVVPTWDRAAVTRWLTSLGHIRRSARSATLTIGITKQRIAGSRSGWRVDPAALRRTVEGALADPAAARGKLAQRVVRVAPATTITDLRRRNGTIVTADRATFKLRLFKRLRLVKTYPIAVGAAGHGTPAGRYTVTSRQVNPVWHVPNSAWAGSLAGTTVPGGAPNNPLKARWLGLRDGIGIHGTAETWSLGSRASHGCLRMHPSDVIALYPRVPMGTPVIIR